jgi:hypothetical protein
MARIDSQYLPAITDARQLALTRIESISDGLRTPADASWFLLSYLALRVGPLRRVPEWLQATAAACMVAQPGVAVDLFETAKLERSQQLVLLEDLIELRLRTPDVDFRALTRQPFDPRIEQHLRVRKLVPTASVPTIVLAIDLELSLLERDGGAVLLDACRRSLGAVGSRFLGLRQRSAEQRIHARCSQLRTVLDQQPSNAPPSWAAIAGQVLLTYVDTLDACAARRPTPHSTSPPPHRHACAW